MTQPDIKRLLEFQKLLLTFSQIQRVVDRKQHASYTRENDSEHSYNLAMTAWYLSSHFPKLDRDLLLRYALVHDLVEVHAGDTYIYAAQEELAGKHDRETTAIKQLKQDWPDFPDMAADIAAYEARSDSEAKFIYALDKIMPIMQIYLNDGYTWHKQGITPERLNEVKKAKVNLSPEIKPYYDALYRLLLENCQLFG